ncbi:MAG TPA: DNA primase [Nevskiaceae bacterium]|nr:DNA primase [Nevskiaceae bacterium]
MADELEEIKRKIDIVELISEFVPLKKVGRNFKALCPFHSEKTPSFIVSPERQIWHCFGSCGEGGDIFGFLMKMEGVEFGEALRILAKRAGVRLARYQPSQSERQKQELYEINHLSSEYYHYVLLNHPAGKEALAYIQGRGISKDSLEKFKIGFAPNMWEGLQKFLVGKKNYSVQNLEKAGLVIKGRRGFYDRFRARVVFPLKDHRGNICGFAGRVIVPEVKEAKYINTPETLAYHKSNLLYGLGETSQEIKKKNEAVLVEGELDAISSYQAGVKNVAAIKGSALTLNQVQLLGRFTKNITFALDADIAGNQAARRGIEIADAAGLAIKVVAIKGGKDPDEVAQKKPELWQELVAKAVPVYDYLLDSAFARFGSSTAEGKRKIGQETIPVLAKITDKIVQSHYLLVLTERLGVREEAVLAEIEKLVKKEKGDILTGIKAAVEEKSRREILEEHLLGLCFQSENWAFLRKRKIYSLIKTPRFARILETLGQYLKRFKGLKSERLAKMLAPELLASFNRLYFLDLSDLVKDEMKFERELVKAVQQLEMLNLKEKLEEIAAKIKTLEEKSKLTGKELKTLDKLNLEFSQLSQELNVV